MRVNIRKGREPGNEASMNFHTLLQCANSIILLQVKWKDLMKLNVPDWPLVTTGIVTSCLVGCLFPLMSILFSEMLEVCVHVCVCVCVCVCECV